MNRQHFIRLVLVVSVGLLPFPGAAQAKAAASPVPVTPEPISSARSGITPPSVVLQTELAGRAPGDGLNARPLSPGLNKVQDVALAPPSPAETEVRSVVAEDTLEEESRDASIRYHLALASPPHAEQQRSLLQTPVGGVINQSTTWSLAGSPYLATSDVTVQSGVTLTVEAGVEVRFNSGAGLFVQGALRAVGTPTQPITFTSSSTTPAPGQWNGIFFEPGSDNASNLLEYVTVSYAGQSSYWSSYWPSYYISTGIGTASTSPIIRHTTVQHSSGHGLVAFYGAPILSHDRFVQNNNNGVYALNTTLRINNCIIENNKNVGIRVQNSTVTAQHNRITGNTSFGIENVSDGPVVRATHNWWGHTSGPYDPAGNPDGQGSAVTRYVAYEPWLVSTTARQPAVLSLGQAVTGTVSPFDYQDYRLDTGAGLSLLVEVTPLSGSPTLWVFGRLGDLPLWTLYDLRAQEPAASGAYELLITPTQSGPYYFSVYGRDVPGSGTSYRLVVNTVGRRLSSVTPSSAGNAGQVTLSLSGLPFVEGMAVELRRAGSPTLAADQVTLVSLAALWAHLVLSGAAAGVYDVYAIWPDSGEAGLMEAFTITSGVGPHLDARLVPPERSASAASTCSG